MPSLYFTGITTYMYTELAPKLTATSSAAQSVDLEIQDRGFNSQPEALELHWVLKCISF